jgi:genome maintenance exonuclease 1
MFKHDPVKIAPSKLIETDDSHFYETPSGYTYPSVNTVLSKTRDNTSLKKWRDREPHADYILRTAVSLGTQTHKLIECYLKSGDFPLDYKLLAHAHFKKILPYLQNITDIYGIEQTLYSDKLKMGGTTDCIAKYKGKVSIIDFKTKRRKPKEQYLEDYFIQTTAYGLMFQGLTGIKVESIVILVSAEDNTTMEIIKNPADYMLKLKNRIDQYYR